MQPNQYTNKAYKNGKLFTIIKPNKFRIYYNILKYDKEEADMAGLCKPDFS